MNLHFLCLLKTKTLSIVKQNQILHNCRYQAEASDLKMDPELWLFPRSSEKLLLNTCHQETFNNKLEFDFLVIQMKRINTSDFRSNQRLHEQTSLVDK